MCIRDRLKPGKLTDVEFTSMKQHTSIGHEILKDSPSKFLALGAEIALGHHEKFDGTGYPSGLKGKEIPLEARIVAVADVFDALTSERPYKKAWTCLLYTSVFGFAHINHLICGVNHTIHAGQVWQIL